MTGTRSTVLVVEDERESRDTLRELLELEGYRVETAVNGREALERLSALPDSICIMLLDLVMPDGWQVIEQLKADGRLAETRILITTSAAYKAPPGIRVFEKPLDLDEVMKEVERLC